MDKETAGLEERSFSVGLLGSSMLLKSSRIRWIFASEKQKLEKQQLELKVYVSSWISGELIFLGFIFHVFR